MRRLLVLLWLCVVSSAHAMPSEPHSAPHSATGVRPSARDVIALVPLDSRPATSTLPVDIAAVGGARVVIPPLELLGTGKRGANSDDLWPWLFDTNARALVVSLDAFAYGGLVQSRSSERSADDAWNRLWWVRLWHQVTLRPVHAFITIPRAPDATDRARNLDVVRRVLDWAADGTFERLSITWDDALPGSPAPKEGAELGREVQSRGLRNVLVYPGADEAASTLLSRLLLEERQATPRVYVEYSDPSRADEIIRYDGLPLRDSVRAQATAAGLEVVSEQRADVTLYVFNGGDMRRAAVRLSVLARRGPVAFVDIANVNKASTALVNDVVVLERYFQLYAFAAWGTPGNNFGSALAQAGLRVLAGPGMAQTQLLARAYINDYVYSSIVRDAVRRRWAEGDLGQPAANAGLLEILREAFAARLPGSGFCVSLNDAVFPWARSFEVQFDVTVQPKTGRGCP